MIHVGSRLVVWIGSERGCIVQIEGQYGIVGVVGRTRLAIAQRAHLQQSVVNERLDQIDFGRFHERRAAQTRPELHIGLQVQQVVLNTLNL